MMRYALKNSGLIWIWITLIIIGLDRYTKGLALEYLSPYDPIYIAPFFNFTLAFNKGAAFSFLHGASGWQNVVLGSFACLVSIIILIWLYRTSFRDYFLCLSLTFILGGALGNVWDRILYQHVVDFLHFHIANWSWPIFNVADSAVCIGAFILFLSWLRSPK